MTKNTETATRVEVAWADLGPVEEAALCHDLAEQGVRFEVGASDDWGNVGVVASFNSSGDVPAEWFSRKKSARQVAGGSSDRSPDWLSSPMLSRSSRSDRFELAELEALVGWPTVAEMATVVGVATRTISKWKANGLTERQADRASTGYDLHPVLVWPTFGVEPWDPWAALAATDISLMWTELADMGGGALALVGKGERWVMLHPSLAGDDRAAAEALTHELIHHERGVGGWSGAELEVEEASVQRLTDERMRGYRSSGEVPQLSEGARWSTVGAAGWDDGQWDPWTALEASGVDLRWSADRFRDDASANTADGEAAMFVFDELAGDDQAAAAAVTRELIRHELGRSWERRTPERFETDERTVQRLAAERMLAYRPSVLAV